MLARAPQITLVLLYLAIYVIRIGEPGLKMDGMTYAALAKHVVESGVVWPLHYSKHYYSDFFMHPPLGVWLHALAFKIFGISDGAARVVGALTSAVTAAAVWAFVKRRFGLQAAFFSVLLIFTHSRFIKYTSDAYLDGPLACFAVCAALGAAEGYWIGAGLFAALALLTKGVAAGFLVIPLAWSWASQGGRRARAEFAGRFIVGLALPFAVTAWITQGMSWIAMYFQQSVQGRLLSAPALDRLADPWIAFVVRGLPLSALSVWAIWRVTRNRPMLFSLSPVSARASTVVWLVTALSIPLAYSLKGLFLEHYLTPMVPFLAMFVGVAMAEALRPKAIEWVTRSAFGLSGVAVAVALFAPISFHHERLGKVGDVIRAARAAYLPEGTTLVGLAPELDLWYTLAAIRWHTHYDYRQIATRDVLTREPLAPGEVLIDASGGGVKFGRGN